MPTKATKKKYTKHKPNPRSVLKTLPEAKQKELRKYLLKHTLEEGVDWCADKWQVFTNDTSMGEWVQWYDISQRLSSSMERSRELMGLLKEHGSDTDLVAKLGELAFLLEAAENKDLKSFKQAASIVQRFQELAASKAAHRDNLEIKRETLQARRKGLSIALRKLRAAEKRIQVLEQRNKLMQEAATKAKDKIGGMVNMTPKAKSALMKAMDDVLGLGRHQRRVPTGEGAGDE